MNSDQRKDAAESGWRCQSMSAVSAKVRSEKANSKLSIPVLFELSSEFAAGGVRRPAASGPFDELHRLRGKVLLCSVFSKLTQCGVEALNKALSLVIYLLLIRITRL